MKQDSPAGSLPGVAMLFVTSYSFEREDSGAKAANKVKLDRPRAKCKALVKFSQAPGLSPALLNPLLLPEAAVVLRHQTW